MSASAGTVCESLMMLLGLLGHAGVVPMLHRQIVSQPFAAALCMLVDESLADRRRSPPLQEPPCLTIPPPLPVHRNPRPWPGGPRRPVRPRKR